MARYMRQYGQSDLRPPAVVGAGIAWHGPGVYLTYPGFIQDREGRRKAKSVLRPPRVVTPASVAPVETVVQTTLAPSHRRSRKTRPTYVYPIVVNAPTEAWGYIGIQLAPQRRGTPKSKLRPPAVVASRESFFGPKTHLAYSRRGRPKSHLGVETNPAEPFPDCGYPITDNFNRANQNPIGPPWDTNLLGTLNYAQILSNELAPVASGGEVEGYAVYGRPVLPGDFEVIVTLPNGLSNSDAVDFSLATEGTFFVTFGNSSGDPHVSFSSPAAAVVQVTAFQAGCKIGVRRIGTFFEAWRQQPGGNWERLAVLSGADATLSDYFYLRITGAAGSAVVVDDFSLCPTVHAPVAVTAAASRRGSPSSILRPPVFITARIYFGPDVTLTKIRPRRVRSFLRPPADTVGLEDQGRVRIKLAPQRRGRPVYFLNPPTDVVDAQDQGRVSVHLAYSRRGRPVYELRPPAVISRPPAYQQVIPPVITYSRRGRPVYFLNPPTVVFPFFARRVDVTLSPQTRGRPTSFLSPPAILRERGQVQVHLAYSRRGRPLSVLRPPRVVRLAVEIYGPETQLAYSRRGRPRSFLLPPEVVGRPPFRGILTHLAYSRRGRGFILKQPELQKVVFRGLQVHLTYSRRGRPKSFLRPPVVVRVLQAGVLQIHLTRVRPRKTRFFLKPPTVVGAGVAFYGPQIHLTRIKHPPVQHFLRQTLVAFRRPSGDVCGFDIAGSFVCEMQVPGSRVSGSDAAVHGVTGTSRAANTVTGSDSAGGSVSGSDRKAT